MTGVLHSVIANSRPRTLYGIIQELGLTSSLNLVLDVADTASYDGSSQTWTDATGNGFNFFRGTTSGATATDPTFNGTAGLPDETTYFSFDGGDLFKETAAHAFADNWHKNNGAFTVLAVMYVINLSAVNRLFSNRAGSTPTDGGINFRITSNEFIELVHSTDNSNSETLTGTNAATQNVFNLLAIRFDEANLTTSFVTNATAETIAATASTSTEAPASNLRIACDNDTPTNAFESGTRLACVAAWSVALTTTQIGQIYERLKARRFTSMP